MKQKRFILLILIVLGLSAVTAGCIPLPPCNLVGFETLTVYRLPDASSDVFGTLPAGEAHQVLAYTADGWMGFDPGIAQAGNIGLAHHRWVQLNVKPSPHCLQTGTLTTLADVLTDVAASGGP